MPESPETPPAWSGAAVSAADLIHSQHLHISELVATMQQPQDADAATNADVVIRHATRYMSWHFITEESLMESVGYPAVEEHRIEHRLCAERLAAFANQGAGGDYPPINIIGDYLADWLEHHRVHSDLKFELYLSRLRAA